MAKIYGVTINIEAELESFKKQKGRDPLDTEKIEIRETKEAEIISAWRKDNQKIVLFWAGVNEAAMQAVKTGGSFSYGRIKFGMRGRFLHCRLPSGRLLSYCDPRIETITTKYGQKKDVIGFMGFDATTNQWRREYTYGGKLTENIVQAAARDLLRDALFRLEAEGYDNTVLHIHDEILNETDPDGDLKAFENIIAEVPAWAEGCPIAVEGWEGQRYRK
jgi:DNA polymerase